MIKFPKQETKKTDTFLLTMEEFIFKKKKNDSYFLANPKWGGEKEFKKKNLSSKPYII